MRWRVFRQVAATSMRDYLRTPEAVFWTYGFPLMMALGLGLAFGEGGSEPSRVAVVEASRPLFEALEPATGEGLELELIGDAEVARRRLVLGGLDAVLSGTAEDPALALDATRPGSELAELRVERALRAARGEVDPGDRPEIVPVSERGGRYIDFLIPGLIGINLLGAGIYGVGYNVVQMRVKNLLRRVFVTPVGRSEFLIAYLASRLLLALLPPFVILAFGMLAFGVPLPTAQWLAVVALVISGAAAFSGLGLLIASRVRTQESVAGLMNLTMLPMWLLGGAFFSNDRFPAALQPLVHALPLTWITDGLRAAMLGARDGLGPWSAAAVLCGFAALSTAFAARLFRWT